MAKTLNKIGITTGNTVEAYHVTQSVDAFTAIDNYDISLSGSFNMTGSINGEPTVINPLTASYAMTASYALSASYAISASHEIIKEVSSSHANFADTASYVETAQTASFVNLAAGPNITINQSGTTFEISGSGGGGGSVDTGSFYLSSSVNIGTITFTQGDGTTESVTVEPTGSGQTWVTFTDADADLNTIPATNYGIYSTKDSTVNQDLNLPGSGSVGDKIIVTRDPAVTGTTKQKIIATNGATIKFFSESPTETSSNGFIRWSGSLQRQTCELTLTETGPLLNQCKTWVVTNFFPYTNISGSIEVS